MIRTHPAAGHFRSPRTMLQALLFAATSHIATLAPADGADWIRLDDGKQMQGRVVQVGKEALRIHRGRGEVEIPLSRVVEWRSIEKSLAELLERAARAPRGDVGANVELARFAAERELVHEARNFWLRVMLLDPSHPGALEGAGGRKSGSKVQLQSGKQWTDSDEFFATKSKWKDAIEIRTAHFTFHTDVAVDQALDAALRAEKHYLRFYDFLGPEVGLYVFDEVPEIRVYSNAADFPSAWRSTSAQSWFAPGENALHVLLSEDRNLRQLFHDATDALLFNAFRRSSGKTGQIPPWAVEGISQYFSVTAGHHPDDPWAPLGKPFGPLFTVVANDPKPVEIKPLLRSSHQEFRNGPDGARRSAAAYALVHYLLNGDDGRHAQTFFALLRDAWRGKSIEKELLAAFGGTPRALEEALLAHARGHAR